MARRPYRVEVERAVAKEIARLHPEIQRRITTALLALESESRPVDCQKLAGEDELYRIRVGDYRIVYSIGDAGRVVIVLVASHRRDVYRNLQLIMLCSFCCIIFFS
jgi:mRNA interferase RelE/StbE